MKFDKSQLPTLVLGIFVGVVGVLLVQSNKLTTSDQVTNRQASHRGANDRKVFAQANPQSDTQVNRTQQRDDAFAQMDRIRDQMRQQMNQMNKMMDGAFTGNSPFDGQDGLNSGVEVTQGEDDQYKFIKIAGEGVDKDSLDIQIKNGMVSISGRMEHKSGDGQSYESTSISSFTQSFNTPSGVNEEDVKFDSEDGALVLKFRKL